MIFEVIASSFISGLGSTVFRELMNQARKKDEAQLRALIRQELKAFQSSSPSISITVNDVTINEIIRRLETGETSAYPIYPRCRNDSAIYRIVSVLSEKALDVSDGRTDNGAPIIQYDYHGGANQHWRLIPINNNGDIFKIISQHSGKVLDVSDGRTDNSAPIIQYDYHGEANQHWRLIPINSDSDVFKIISQHSDKSLDVTDYRTDNGTPIIQYDYHGGTNQRWKLIRVD